MALASRQDNLMQQEAASHGGGYPIPVEVGLSPMTLVQFRNMLKGVVWDANKFALDMCEVLAADDRQWKVARKLIMDRMMEAERTYMNLIHVMLQKEIPVGTPGQETTNGNA
jgi:hypothetical protein